MRGRGLGAPESLLKHTTSVLAKGRGRRSYSPLCLYHCLSPFALRLPRLVFTGTCPATDQRRRFLQQMPSLRRCRHLQGPHHAHC